LAVATSTQRDALGTLWEVFAALPINGRATCVGISKAVLLVTDGRIGPALDSTVRERTGLPRPANGGEWLACLAAIGEELAEFESRHGPVQDAVSPRFRHLAAGRLYDMALGPRG
jgi:hypothetical protein